MPKISFHKLQPDDDETISLISLWYFQEWKIAPEDTLTKLANSSLHAVPFHMILTVDGVPVATGGIHHDVNLINAEPRFKKFDPWLALVYTKPERRGTGYGAMLCVELQKEAAQMGLREIFLYTVTAEKLYARLGWEVMERIHYANKDCAVMRLSLK